MWVVVVLFEWVYWVMVGDVEVYCEVGLFVLDMVDVN